MEEEIYYQNWRTACIEIADEKGIDDWTITALAGVRNFVVYGTVKSTYTSGIASVIDNDGNATYYKNFSEFSKELYNGIN